MRVGILNVKYSPNLGDGLIADCLEAQLRASSGIDQAFSIDLAGRTGFGSTSGRARRIVLATTSSLPGEARRRVLEPLLSRQIRAAEGVWRQAFERIDALVIGGGQIFADADLNFPRKLARAVEVAPEIPIAIHGVGVSPGWSDEGARLFANVLTDRRIISISVRDERSYRLLVEAVPQLSGRVGIVPDPAFLAGSVYGAQPRLKPERRPMIGIGVVSPQILRLHAENAPDASPAFFASLCRAIGAFGDPVLFTNGAGEDEAAKRRVAALLKQQGLRYHLAPVPQTPAALVNLIAALDGVTAHRLHANIAALSLGLPAVGLVGEEKIAAFYQDLGHPSLAIRPGDQAPEHIGARVKETVTRHPMWDDVSRQVDVATASIVQLAETLTSKAARSKRSALGVE